MRKLLIPILLFVSCTFIYSQTLKSPEEFLGYKVGSDFKIADYETIQKYFKHISENSDKIIYKEIGKTSLGRDMFMVILSSADNLKTWKSTEILLKHFPTREKLTTTRHRN